VDYGFLFCVYILVFCIFINFYFRSLVSCVLWVLNVCVYILVFCIFITFYFRSIVSCGLWVPLFVFIFLYFVSLSPFILDPLCLVDCGFLCLCLYSCILYLYHLLFEISCVLCTVGSSFCVYILVFCIFITFYFRSLVSCGLWVPMLVFIFLYFVSLSPFILDLLCLGYCEFLCLCLYSCICIFITFYFRSLVSCVLWVPLFVFIFLYFVSRSPFNLDLLCLVDCEFLGFCLYSCILYLYHLLFFILGVLWTVGSSVLCLYSCILYLDHLLF
jgi:hypothetical protein